MVSLYVVIWCSFLCVHTAQVGKVDMRCTLVVCVSVCAYAKWLYSMDMRVVVLEFSG